MIKSGSDHSETADPKSSDPFLEKGIENEIIVFFFLFFFTFFVIYSCILFSRSNLANADPDPQRWF